MTGSGYVRRVSRAAFHPLKGRSPLLGRLDVELTERCNNRCLHCYINRPEDDAGAAAREMETEFVLDVLRQAADLGCLEVRFTGGEPLLRRDFPELYLGARKLGMKVVLFTNARLVTPEIAALLARYPPGVPVEVSVYGLGPASYDAAAGARGAYDEFRRGLDLLLRHGVPVVVKQAVLPSNRGEEFEAWAADVVGMEGPPDYAMNFDLRARRDDPAKNRRIAALRLTPEETVEALARQPDAAERMREFCGRFMRAPGDRLFSCGAGHGVCVDSFGYAQMCLLLRHPGTVCDLRTTTLRQVLTDIFPYLRGVRAQNPEYLGRCAVCFLNGLCKQCPARSWMEHGTLDTPVEYHCRVAHARARWIGLLRTDEHAWEVTDGDERAARLSSGT